MNDDTKLEQAIQEQQSRVWRLRSLIECVSVAGDGGGGIDDPDAALEGLVDYAESVHRALDFKVLTERARELAKAKASVEQPAKDAPDSDPETDEHTGNRMRAFVASMRTMRGCVFYADLAERQQRGRSLIERLALSAPGDDSPRLRLTPLQCADVLAYLGSVEPLDPEGWWRDPADGPSPVCGYYAVLHALEESLRPESEDAEDGE